MNSRLAGAAQLEKLFKAEFQNLSLTDGEVRFEILEKDLANPLSALTINGLESIAFQYRSFKDGKFFPVHKVASGGELSRIYLALEVVMAEFSDISIYLFDEVDAGIGGKTGLVVGERCAHLAAKFQVFIVTHLAQVAIWGDSHFAIKKSVGESIAASDIHQLSGAERVSEVARLLSGEESSVNALAHSQELLDLAQNGKANFS
jgi:DNA repair protein RecN (Recombination protein N)